MLRGILCRHGHVFGKVEHENGTAATRLSTSMGADKHEQSKYRKSKKSSHRVAERYVGPQIHTKLGLRLRDPKRRPSQAQKCRSKIRLGADGAALSETNHRPLKSTSVVDSTMHSDASGCCTPTPPRLLADQVERTGRSPQRRGDPLGAPSRRPDKTIVSIDKSLCCRGVEPPIWPPFRLAAGSSVYVNQPGSDTRVYPTSYRRMCLWLEARSRRRLPDTLSHWAPKPQDTNPDA